MTILGFIRLATEMEHKVSGRTIEPVTSIDIVKFSLYPTSLIVKPALPQLEVAVAPEDDQYGKSISTLSPTFNDQMYENS